MRRRALLALAVLVAASAGLAPAALGYGTSTVYASSSAGTPPGAWAAVPAAGSAADGGAVATLTETDAGGVAPTTFPSAHAFDGSLAGWSVTDTSAVLCAISSAHDGSDGAPAGSIRSTYGALLNLLGLLAWCNSRWESDTFTWDDGVPASVAFSMDRAVDANGLLGLVTTTWEAHLVDETAGTTTPLVSGNATTDLGWATQAAAGLGPEDIVPGHTYRIRIDVAFSSLLSLVSGLGFNADNAALAVTPQAQQASGELHVDDVPAGTTATLELRARTSGEPFAVEVWDGATWTTRATVTAASLTTLTHGLTAAEWNGGDVRVRFTATGTGADATADVLSVDWLRVVSTGGITVSGPTSVTLPAVTIDGTAPAVTSGPLGDVTVTDSGGAASGWAPTATATRWALDGSPATLLPADAFTASPTAPAAPDGDSLAGVSAGAGGTFSTTTPITLMTASAGNGIGAFRQNPVLELTIPVTTLHGVYRSDITLSAS
ncbi:MAG: hypothetical protein AB7V62_03090 [Thermoleophilia bacterium]